MRRTLLMYARYSKRANESAFAFLDGVSTEALNEDRKSYYGSLAGLAAHIVGATLYFHSLYRASSPAVAAALKATEGLKTPHDKDVSPAEWRELRRIGTVADQATIDMILALDDEALDTPVRLDWYGGDPDAVPLYFLAHQLFVHGTHHRGQLSQILDSMGIEHDFSGIDLEFMTR